MLCVAAAILLPIASLSPATSLDTPTIDVPDQPMDTATATATVDGNGVVTDAGGSAAGKSHPTRWQSALVAAHCCCSSGSQEAAPLMGLGSGSLR